MENVRPKLDGEFAQEAGPSLLRAWGALVWLSLQRQARLRQMVAIALVLMLFAVALVAGNTALGAWSIRNWRKPYRVGPTFTEWTEYTAALYAAFGPPGDRALPAAVLGSCQAIIDSSGFLVFSRYVVFLIFLSFLLPLWSLSFATEAVGGEREANTMVWLLSRPLPRPAIYLAKFVALLPWTLGLNIGGFALLCLAAGEPGLVALRLFWPAVAWATLAFSSLFCLMGAYFRRPAVVALLYAFFLEALFGNLPGYFKRISVGFFARCMMFEAAQDYGLQPQKPSVFLPVEGPTACAVLLAMTVGFLVLGMIVFTRSQYHEVV
jgi:ABC-type transport system involved in multi-copper enzyme maturation permease subunit